MTMLAATLPARAAAVPAIAVAAGAGRPSAHDEAPVDDRAFGDVLVGLADAGRLPVDAAASASVAAATGEGEIDLEQERDADDTGTDALASALPALALAMWRPLGDDGAMPRDHGDGASRGQDATCVAIDEVASPVGGDGPAVERRADDTAASTDGPIAAASNASAPRRPASEANAATPTAATAVFRAVDSMSPQDAPRATPVDALPSAGHDRSRFRNDAPAASTPAVPDTSAAAGAWAANAATPEAPALARARADVLALHGAEPAQWRPALKAALGERLQVQVGERAERAVIRLDPPTLGRIEIVIRHEAGNLQVHLSASNGDVLRQLHVLTENLRQDLVHRQYGEVAVTVSDLARDGAGQRREREADEARDAAPGHALAENDGARDDGAFATLHDREGALR